MPFSSIVIKLLLLVIVAGNLALASLDRDPLLDLEAVAEWRLDPDTMDEDSGSEPPMPAIIGFFRETLTFVVVSNELPQHTQPITRVRTYTCTTRAPPIAALA